MKNLRIISLMTLCSLGAFFGTLAMGQAMPKPAPGTNDARITFSDKPEFLVLPKKGEANAVECAVYAPQPSDAGAKQGLVLHLYGRGGSCRQYNMMNPPFATVRQLLWERGYWLVVPGLGTDHWMKDAAVKSIEAIIDGMIRDHGVDPHRIHILGTSMGGGCGLIYIMRRPGRIQSICALFPMTDFSQWVKEKPQYLPGIAAAHGVKPTEAASLLRALSPLEHASAFRGIPVLLLHGDADSIVPVHHSREFAAALQKQGSPVTLREAPGLSHDNAVAKPFQQEMVEFLTDTFPLTNNQCFSRLKF